ncbi:hypothetical protein PABG_05766 [Paracoccidioides brasiliensis Pb03]|nr:hypothetical protein PABG_05766 [Paracoccidioides brasiliensis Pb03]
MANATSITLNLLSTSQSPEVLITIAAVHPSCQNWGLIRRSSARNMNAHRSPHHAAGRTLRPRQNNKGIYQRRSTPNITATRGWRAETTSQDVSQDVEVEVSDDGNGDGGTTVNGGGEGIEEENEGGGSRGSTGATGRSRSGLKELRNRG